MINHDTFKGFGRLIFPVHRHISNNLKLRDLDNVLIWYNHVNPSKTVEVINYMKEHSESGENIFFDIYSDEEKKLNPEKRNTGLFFFRGEPGKNFAICNAGGGFTYVGAIHDSFPHALEIAKRGYNSFVLIYRPNAQLACEDLARAIAFIHEHAEELQVDVKDYSLWGGSAGARMVAWLSSFGTERFNEKKYPRPCAVIMQYTGLSEVYGTEPPTYSCVGTDDSIASYRTMLRRTEMLRMNGTEAEIDVFKGLPHGFGLGEGTAAEGWINHAIAFWQSQIRTPQQP